MTEVELCERIRDWAERLGFDVYPEVSGWDMVLVARAPLTFGREHGLHRDGNVQSGHQIGIHAKLRANCDVLAQAMPPDVRWCKGHKYPDLPFVAAPSPGAGFRTVARRIGLGVIDTDPRKRQRKWFGKEAERRASDPSIVDWPNYDRSWRDLRPLDLPPVASRTIAAGSPSPRVLSPWRVSALRFLAFARGAETWTVADLQRFGVNRSWADRWGEVVETRPEVRRGRTVRIHVYRLTDRAGVLPDAGYEDVAAELLAAEISP